jgi:hypothetical protein
MKDNVSTILDAATEVARAHFCHRPYENESMWLCADQTYLEKQGVGSTQRHSRTTPAPGERVSDFNVHTNRLCKVKVKILPQWAAAGPEILHLQHAPWAHPCCRSWTELSRGLINAC